MKLVCFMAVMRFIPSKTTSQPVFLVPYPLFFGGGSLRHTSKEKLFRGKIGRAPNKNNRSSSHLRILWNRKALQIWQEGRIQPPPIFNLSYSLFWVKHGRTFRFFGEVHVKHCNTSVLAESVWVAFQTFSESVKYQIIMLSFSTYLQLICHPILYAEKIRKITNEPDFRCTSLPKLPPSYNNMEHLGGKGRASEDEILLVGGIGWPGKFRVCLFP